MTQAWKVSFKVLEITFQNRWCWIWEVRWTCQCSMSPSTKTARATAAGSTSPMARSGVAAVEAASAVTVSTRTDSKVNSAKQLAWQAVAITCEKWRVRLAAAAELDWKSKSLAAEVALTAVRAIKCRQEGFELFAGVFESQCCDCQPWRLSASNLPVCFADSSSPWS